MVAGISVFRGRGYGLLYGQEPNPTAQMAQPQDQQIEKQDNGIYLYRVKVNLQRDLDAVNYLHRSGSTDHCVQGHDVASHGEG